MKLRMVKILLIACCIGPAWRPNGEGIISFFESHKKVQVVQTAESLSDLEIIYDFIADRSVTAAEKTVRSVLSGTRQSETFPESGSPYTENMNR